jgi:hypothetical protein
METRLNTWQQTTSNWGKLWQNRQGWRKHDRTNTISTLLKNGQVRLTSGSVRCGYPQQQWQRSQNNTDNSSDNELIQAPLSFQWLLKWGQLMVRTNSSVHQFTADMTDKRWNVSHHKKLKLNSIHCCHFVWYFAAVITFLVEKANCYYQQYLKLPWWWTFSSTWCHWTWNVSVSSSYYSNGIWHTLQIQRLLNSSFSLSVAKQWDVTDSFTFLNFYSFKTMTMILIIMTKCIYTSTLPYIFMVTL